MSQGRRAALLFLVSTLSQFPLSTIRFIAPIYAVSLGATPFVLGAMGASYGLVYIFLAMYFGGLAERVGYGRMIALGLATYACVVMTYPFVRSPYELIIVRGGEAVGMAMVWPAIEAYSQAVREDRLERSVMIYTLSWSVAASAAPYAGALLVSRMLVAAIVVSAVSVAGALTGLAIGATKPVVRFNLTERISTAYDIVLPIFIFGFNYSVITSFYPAYGKSIGLGVLGTGYASAISGLAMVLAFLVSGLIRGIQGRPFVTLGLALQVFLLGVYFGRGLFVQAISLSLVMFGEGLMYFNVLLGIITNIARGVGLRTGIFESSIGLGSILGPLASGTPTALGLRLPWALSASVSAAALVFYAYRMLSPGRKGPERLWHRIA